MPKSYPYLFSDTTTVLLTLRNTVIEILSFQIVHPLPYGSICHMERSKASLITSRELTILLLRIAAAGVLIIGVAIAPGLGLLLKQYGGKNQFKPKQVRQRINDLERRGYLERHNTRLTMTARGVKELSEGEVWSMTWKTPRTWDGTWHVVLFDIPGKKERARQALRQRLWELGYRHYQHSVYIHKYDLRKIVLPFANFYGVKQHLHFIHALKID